MTDRICTWLSTAQPASGEAFPFPPECPLTLDNQTLHQSFRISAGGSKLRLLFSNRYGAQPLLMGETRLSANDSSGKYRTLPVTFNGETNATIPAGGVLYSDEIDLIMAPLTVVTLRTYLPQPVTLNTFHWDARHSSLLGPGNQTATGPAGQTLKITSRLLLERADILPVSAAQTVVVIGDSMVDGNSVEMDTYGRWSDYLAERITGDNLAVVNAGQSGSRLLKDGIGISTLSRFDRDVLQLPGVKSCIVQIGLNDLGLAGTALDPLSPAPSAAMIIDAWRQMLNAAREQNIRMLAVTLVPLRSREEYGMAQFWQPEKDVIRQELNHWLRTSGEFDAIIDADARVRDPACPQQLNPVYDCGDHLHLNTAGHRLLAEAITPAMLTGK